MSIKAKPISNGFGVAAGNKTSAATPSHVKPDIKTKGELDYRQKQRAIPNPVLEPKSVTQRLSSLRQRSNRRNENRIAVLKNNLLDVGKDLRLQHRLSVLRGDKRAPTKALQPHGKTR